MEGLTNKERHKPRASPSHTHVIVGASLFKDQNNMLNRKSLHQITIFVQNDDTSNIVLLPGFYSYPCTDNDLWLLNHFTRFVC